MDRRDLLKCALASSALTVSSSAFAALVCENYGPYSRRCEAGIASELLNVSAIVSPDEQKQANWCWAACISMVFAYYGHRISQTRIVFETWGAIADLPGQPADVLRNLNRNWTDDDGAEFTVTSGPGSTNPAYAAQDLANDMPLIIGSLGHAVVLSSLIYSTRPYGVGVDAAIVRDPYPGRGRRVLSALEWSNISFAAQIRVA